MTTPDALGTPYRRDLEQWELANFKPEYNFRSSERDWQGT